MMAPGGRRKYTRRILSEGLSSAGKTVFLPDHETCHFPDLFLVGSSSCHSTIMTFVPSLPRPGSNSKRARAVTDDRVSGWMGDPGLAGVSIAAITPDKGRQEISGS